MNFVQNGSGPVPLYFKILKMEKQIEHKELVRALVKPGEKVIATLTAAKADMWHAVTGIVGEAGELLDVIKKTVIYNKVIDRQNIVEELGDIEFYMEQLRQRTGITREETIRHNIAKLSERYEGLQYTDEKAQARADKNLSLHTCSKGSDGCCVFCSKKMDDVEDEGGVHPRAGRGF